MTIVIRRVIPHLFALLFVCGATLCVPARGSASSGGVGIRGSGDRFGSSVVEAADQLVSASANGVTIATQASVILRNGLVVTGSVGTGTAGKTVEIQRWGAKTHWAWQNTTQAPVRRGGRFVAVWTTNHIGRFALRAVVQPAGGATASAGMPIVTVTIYRPAIATLYGPGFYGSHTACGTMLRRGTVGVANRTLPCGTPVAIYYGGRTLIVPVIDRGPYANGADWDLTIATGKLLGIDTTATIGAVSLPRGG